LLPQAAHCPVAVTQIGVGCAHADEVEHWTHPRIGSHVSLPRHWMVPFTPQMALPGAGPLPPFLPLHAMIAVQRHSVAAVRAPTQDLAAIIFRADCSTFSQRRHLIEVHP
jgi:hypothetical protein